MKNTKIVLFEGKKVRKVLHNNEWWFSVIDAVEILIGNDRPRKYWSDLKKKLLNEGYFEVSEKIGQLKLEAPDGKMRETDCANTETMLRIIQSIPSPKVEPLKQWLAKIGYDRIQEIENPELAANRAREIYRAKGYPQGWIEKRMRGIEVRETLTSEWKNRGAKEGIEYAILTNEILSGTFDMSAEGYKKFKGLKRQNLRDHMDDLELILTMLGEATTTRIHKDRNSKGFEKLKDDAKEGGAVAGNTRKDIEKRTGKKIISKKNFLSLKKNKKLKN
ncbi:MAG: Bro-N domain-containing protein [bacterium]|nr:Bro-N domain-containing protein [bacterium]